MITYVELKYLTQTMAHMQYSIEATVTGIIKCVLKLGVTVSDNYNDLPQNSALFTHEINVI